MSVPFHQSAAPAWPPHVPPPSGAWNAAPDLHALVEADDVDGLRGAFDALARGRAARVGEMRAILAAIGATRGADVEDLAAACERSPVRLRASPPLAAVDDHGLKGDAGDDTAGTEGSDEEKETEGGEETGRHAHLPAASASEPSWCSAPGHERADGPDATERPAVACPSRLHPRGAARQTDENASASSPEATPIAVCSPAGALGGYQRRLAPGPTPTSDPRNGGWPRGGAFGLDEDTCVVAATPASEMPERPTARGDDATAGGAAEETSPRDGVFRTEPESYRPLASSQLRGMYSLSDTAEFAAAAAVAAAVSSATPSRSVHSEGEGGRRGPLGPAGGATPATWDSTARVTPTPRAGVDDPTRVEETPPGAETSPRERLRFSAAAPSTAAPSWGGGGWSGGAVYDADDREWGGRRTRVDEGGWGRWGDPGSITVHTLPSDEEDEPGARGTEGVEAEGNADVDGGRRRKGLGAESSDGRHVATCVLRVRHAGAAVCGVLIAPPCAASIPAGRAAAVVLERAARGVDGARGDRDRPSVGEVMVWRLRGGDTLDDASSDPPRVASSLVGTVRLALGVAGGGAGRSPAPTRAAAAEAAMLASSAEGATMSGAALAQCLALSPRGDWLLAPCSSTPSDSSTSSDSSRGLRLVRVAPPAAAGRTAAAAETTERHVALACDFAVTRVATSPDGAVVVAAGGEGSLHSWWTPSSDGIDDWGDQRAWTRLNARGGLSLPQPAYRGITPRGAAPDALRFAPDGRTLVGVFDGSLWATWKVPIRQPGTEDADADAAAWRLLAASYALGHSLSALRVLDGHVSGGQHVPVLSLLRDGPRTPGEDGQPGRTTLRLAAGEVRLSTRLSTRDAAEEEDPGDPGGVVIGGHMGVPSPTALAAGCGRVAAVGTSSGHLLLWDVAGGTCVGAPTELTGSAVAAADMAPTTPDARTGCKTSRGEGGASLLVAGASDGRVAFYRVDDRTTIERRTDGLT